MSKKLTNREFLYSLDELERAAFIAYKMDCFKGKVWSSNTNVGQRQIEKYGKDVAFGMFKEWLEEELCNI